MATGTTEKICPNCQFNSQLNFRYCPKCGQKWLEESEFSFRHFFWDSLGDYFHVDGKFIHSIYPLILKPGEITRDFLQGKRERFLPPFKMFLFISVLYFITINLTSKTEVNISPGTGNNIVLTGDTSGDAIKGPTNLRASVSFLGKTLSVDSARMLIKEKGLNHLIDSLDPGAAWYEKAIARNIMVNTLQGSDFLTEKMLHTASKVIFLLIPFMGLLLKLIYFRRKRVYYDHIVFSLHFHAFVFLFLLVMDLISFFLFNIPVWFYAVIILAYLLIAMQRVYDKKWKTALKKMTEVVFLYFILAIPLFGLLLITASLLL
ncbi:MAG: DUF3667 domain-containing protein [Bacteroidetes bacterium]|nr:DUF3667 domain-containing protein [Bacteroidota bacterium]